METPVTAQLFINGKFTNASDNGTFSLLSPYTGAHVGTVAEATSLDVESAISAASSALPAWSSISPSARGIPLSNLADLIRQHTSDLALLEALSIGRPISSYFDAHYAYTQLKYFSQAGYAVGTSSLNTPGSLNLSLRQPYGVVAVIIPSNAPLVFLSKKLAPALAAGNTLILKTSEKSPLSSHFVAGLLNQAGFPPGVVNILHGHGVPSGDALARHMKVRALSFTGSVATGRKIMRAAAESNFKHLIFELGGKSPAVVFEDADLEEAVRGTFASIMLNSGQTCMANSRVYVQRGVKEEFVRRFEGLVRERKLGDPEDRETETGPVADRGQWERVNGFLEGVDGGRVEGNGEGVAAGVGDGKGKNAVFIKPTIFLDQPEDSTIMKDEIFGPVICINAFDTEDQALEWANDSEYGLYAAVYTKDLDRAVRVASRLESGMVGVNCTSPTGAWDMPFGGYKQSGMGREGFLESLSDWLEVKSVFVKVKGFGLAGGGAVNSVLGR